MNSYRVQDCLNTFPSSIEQYLRDAGFGGTELLVLRHLLSSGPISTRQLAGKVGKSSSSVDQALHKLMRRSIVLRLEVNGASKFTLGSLDGILHWVEEDTRQKNEELQRRNKSVETFLKTVQKDRSLPEMEHFEGEEGMKTAYRKLLDRGREMLWYLPDPETAGSMEEKFLAQYFRDRRIHKIFTRVLAQDLPYGHQLQMRDAFEHRTTKLMRESRQLFAQEKIIIGDTIACFHHKDQRASFVVYPQLAAMEKSLFDQLWNDDSRAKAAPGAATSDPDARQVLRSFFSKKSTWAVLALLTLISALVSFGLYKFTERLTLDRIGNEAESIASAASFQLDPDDINALQVEEDWQKPAWGRVVRTMERIRVNNPDIRFMYIVRKTAEDPTKMEFVADSHSLNPYANTDSDSTNDVDPNGDGKMGSEDVLQWPGQPYPTPPPEAFEYYEKLGHTGRIYGDSWGDMVTGYAPIMDRKGRSIGVLAVDISAESIHRLIAQSFAPILCFELLFFSLLLFWLSVTGRAVITKVFQKMNIKNVLVFIALAVAVCIVLFYTLYFYIYQTTKINMAERLKAVATTGALTIDVHDLEKIHGPEDMSSPEYERVYRALNDIRSQNSDLGMKYVYVMRKTDDPAKLEFVVDADSRADSWLRGQEKTIGIEPIAPGTAYTENLSSELFTQSFYGPVADDKVDSDKWGTYINGGAPIFRTVGQPYAMLGLDILIERVREITWEKFIFSLTFMLPIAFLLVFSLLWFGFAKILKH